MSNEQQKSKNFFRLNGGLNTEQSELNFPDGYSTDERNYELLMDGSRRRRKGLAAESGQGAARTVATYTSSEYSQCYLWRNVGGDPDKNLMVFRKGTVLHFADADATISGGWYTQSVDFSDYETSGATTAKVDDAPLNFAQGRGYLFVTGQYVQAFYVAFDGTSAFTPAEVQVRIRDYADIEDGYTMTQEPMVATITDDHRYNLRNRGWNEDDFNAYYTAKSKWPAKNAVWYKGYKRIDTTSGVDLSDGKMTWDNDKLEAEAFGKGSAPRGSLFLEPYDTSAGFGVSGPDTSVKAIEDWTEHVTATGQTTWTIQVTGHGMLDGDSVTIEGHKTSYKIFQGGEYLVITDQTLDGTYTIAYVDANNFRVTKASFYGWSDFDSWVNQDWSLGVIDTAGALVRSIGAVHDDSFSCIAFHAGRLWYAGMKNSEFADTIMFSQVADSTSKFGRCHMEADPTDSDFNSIVASDGGFIVISGITGVKNLIPLRNSLLVCANDGIWEITGGDQIFLPDRYRVRKITDAGVASAHGMCVVENSMMYTGPAGIFVISPNQYTGVLEAQNISEQTIQTLWNNISDAKQNRLHAVYDSLQRRVYLMYGPDGTQVGIDTMLIYDLRAGGWTKYTFDDDSEVPANEELVAGFAIPTADAEGNENKKMKFIYKASSTTVNVADFDQTTFDDWHGNNGPLPYMYTAWDNLGDFQRRRQAPVVTVFSARTETGYVDNGSGWDPTNYSSTLMSAHWDWTNDSVTNKIQPYDGSYNLTTWEVYRKVREFAPEDASDVDGYPVVVTRNKVRGRGRVLQLKFEGATDMDSHILGYTVNYKVSRGR